MSKKRNVSECFDRDELWLIYNVLSVRIRQLKKDKDSGDLGLENLIEEYEKLLMRIPKEYR